MKYIKIILFIFVLYTSTGCYNYRELNKIAIASAIAIDIDNEEIEVTSQILNTQKQSSDTNAQNSSTNFHTYTSKGKTIQEAARKIVLESPRRLYINDIDLLVISKEFIDKKGIDNILDFFLRDSESQKHFYVIVSKDCKAKEILTTTTPIETVNSQSIAHSLESTTKYYGRNVTNDFETLADNYLNKKRDIFIPSISIANESKKANNKKNIESTNATTGLKITEDFVFKNEKIIGVLNNQESVAASFIDNKIDHAVVTTKCDNKNYMSINITKSKTKLSTPKNKNQINIDVIFNANLYDINCEKNLSSIKVMKEIGKNFENYIEKNIKKTLNKTIKEYKTDIFGFEDFMYKNNTAFYKKNKNNWDNIFQKMKFKINVKLKSLEKGNIYKTVEREK